MNRYAAFVEVDFICNVHADTAEEALQKAQEMNPSVTRVELVSEDKGVA
jgi:hypothetical protein